MSIDFSFLKNIDLTNSDNLLFFSVITIFVIIAFFIFIFILFELANFIKNILDRIYGIVPKHQSVIGPENKKKELSEEDFSHHKLRVSDFSMDIHTKKSNPKELSAKEKEKIASKEKMSEFFKGFKKKEEEDNKEKDTLESRLPKGLITGHEKNSQIRIKTAKKYN